MSTTHSELRDKIRKYNWSSEKDSQLAVIAFEQLFTDELEKAKIKALLKQATCITSGGSGGTEIFVENVPLYRYIDQLQAHQEKESKS